MENRSWWQNILKFALFGAPLRSARSFLKPPLRRLVGENRLKELYYSAYTRFLPNGGYSRDYYENIERANEFCYKLLSEVLVSKFHPQSLVDIGCGSGGISQAFKEAGCNKVYSFDNSLDAIKLAKSKGLSSVEQLDLTQAESIPARADLCVCFEVAEHLPQRYADRLVRLLSEVAPVIAFTAAPPGQGGHLHVNEQPKEYWIGKFENLGLKYNAKAIEDIRAQFNGRMISDYDNNLMIFEKGK